MATVKVLDPITRLEGHLKMEVRVDVVNGKQQVVEAQATGTLFRGFEAILKGRPPLDAPHITQRVCGVCPVSHGMASVVALEKIGNLNVPPNARILRNLVLGANFVQSHILHFYHLALLDFVDGPNQPPWKPSWASDKRITGAAASGLVGNYVAALDMRRKAHEMGALFGGRLPHPPAYIPGGFTGTPRADRILSCKAYLNTLIPFIQNVYFKDVEKVAAAYSDYYGVGGGYGNLLAYGVFDQDAAGSTKLLKRGRMQAGNPNVYPVDPASIGEQVTHSWYNDTTNNLNPSVGSTLPVYPKTNAYSWLKSPRYQNTPYEVGPLARMWVNGDYRNGVSVMDRHWARAFECLKVAQAMGGWLNQIQPNGPVYTRYTVPTTGAAYGLTEAPRGALGHWVKMAGGLLSSYQIITPTCWNASPKDTQNKRGPLEQALIGTPVANVDEPVEVVRVIHSFDPCLSCAVHVARPREDAQVLTLELAPAAVA